MKRIKICALTTISKTMDWFVVESMRNLHNNGFDITLICNMDEDFISRNKDFATCINLPMDRGIKIGDIFRCTKELTKIFRQEKFDIIYYMTPNVSFYAAIAGKRAGVKNRIYCQNGIRYVSEKGLKRLAFKTVEKVICKDSTTIRSQSPLNMQFAIDEHLCHPNKIKVLGIGGTIGVDFSFCDSFDSREMKKTIRNKLGIPESAFVFGYVGRLNADKGSNELIEAFEQVAKEIDDVYLLHVGIDDLTNPISKKNRDLLCSDRRIIQSGNVPPNDVYLYMSAFDVLVHPTYREGFGKALQEAMGMSLPIITTDVPGPKEVVVDGISGVLVPSRDVDSLSEAMKMLYRNEDKRHKIGQAGRERALQNFERKKMLNNILVDLCDIVKSSD